MCVHKFYLSYSLKNLSNFYHVYTCMSKVEYTLNLNGSIFLFFSPTEEQFVAPITFKSLRIMCSFNDTINKLRRKLFD